MTEFGFMLTFGFCWLLHYEYRRKIKKLEDENVKLWLDNRRIREKYGECEYPTVHLRD